MVGENGRPTSTQEAVDVPRASSRIGLTGSNTEWVIVLVMVAAAMLSAIAVWQASLFAQESATRNHQARFAEGEQARQETAIEAKIANDRQVLLRCQTAIERRDAALQRFSQVFEAQAVAAFAEAEQTRLGLEALLIADGDCAGYDVPRALEWSALNAYQVGFGNPRELLDEAQQYSRAERWAVFSAVAFAAVLLTVTLADAAHGGDRPRWVRRWLVIGYLVAAMGTILAIAAFATAARLPIDALLLVIGLVLLMAAATVGPAAAGPFAPLRPSRVRWERVRRSVRLRLKEAGLGGGARTWAEVFGAVTLVVFALAILGYSDSSSRERDALAEADGLASQARQALEIGQRSGLAALSFVSQLSELDARDVAMAQAPAQEGGGEPRPDVRAREAVLETMWPAEQEAWEGMLSAHRDDGSACLDDDLILAWHRDPEPSGTGDGASELPARLLAAYRDDQGVLYTFVDRSAAGATLCSTRATVTWEEAEAWGRRASLFTIALVALGLAGFLFSQASDADRTKSPRRFLFVSGTVGMIAGIAVALWALVALPDTPNQADLDAGTRAYVEAQIAQLSSDCPAAVAAAQVAVERLDEFAPAHVARADAAYCRQSEMSLIAAGRDADTVDEFIGHLEQARRLGLERGAIVGNLGWAHVLRAIGEGTGEADSSELRQAEDDTGDALALDRSNPFWCFNRAFVALVGGERDRATSFYAEALASLEGATGGTGDCAAVEFNDAAIRNYMRLSALADLELLNDGGDNDSYRSMILAGLPVAEGDCHAEIAASEDLAIFPGSVYLPYTDVEAPVELYSVVWYFRPPGTSTWDVMLDPSWSMVAPGCHGGLTAVGGLLQPGEYRADVYVGGEITQRFATDYDWYGSNGLDVDGFRRVSLPDLGISVVIPTDWKVESSRPGVEITYRGDDGGLVLRRDEGVDSEGLMDELLVWGNDWLEQWGSEPLAAEALGDENAEWYLGLPRTHAVTPRDGLVVGVGHQQYLTLPATGPLSSLSDVTSESCPGSMFMTIIEVEDPAVADTIWQSQYLAVTPHSVVADKVGQEGSFAGPQFVVSIPDGWNAVGCPGSFRAVSPDTFSNVIISSTPYSGMLDAYTAETIAAYEDPAEGFAGFELERNARRVTTDGTRADELTFTWTSDGLLVRQTQLFSVVGGRVYSMTFTTYDDDAERFARDRDLFLESFGLVDVPRILPAACEGCSAQERAERQSNTDQLARFLDVIDDRHCVDSTDGAPEVQLARISCVWAGGVAADFSLWSDGDAFLEHVSPFEGIAGGSLQDWRLRSDDAERIGMTMEWIDGEDARFFWTYDAELVTADATLAGADQDRLNNWWQTTGALLRE